MAIQTTYTAARAQFARLCDEATRNGEEVIITRRGSEDVVLVAASEWAGLRETAHLLRSPKNLERLLRALHRAKTGRTRPRALKTLMREVGLGA